MAGYQFQKPLGLQSQKGFMDRRPRQVQFLGELALEQLFFQRPVPHYADYRSPVRGLYQCGSSTHPGGGVSGIPGHNAAREILKDWKTLSR